jgi:hypothetical protein
MWFDSMMMMMIMMTVNCLQGRHENVLTEVEVSLQERKINGLKNSAEYK